MSYKVIITTAIDQYRTKTCFPQDLPVVPRVGEHVRVRPEFESYYVGKGLPAILEVTSLEYRETNVIVHVHYKPTDIQFHVQNGTIEKLYQ